MIQSAALQNFQSHETSLLEFDPGVNVIIGDSDSGKTAILRALNWVLTNRPTGDAFRRNGSDKTVITIATSNGAISRIRSNRDNVYLDGSGEKLAAIGTSVPESVLKLLQMDPDVSIQRQLDAPFLLSCSAGEVAQRLNAVVGLDDIDVGLSNVAKRVRQNQMEYEGAVKQYDLLSEQVESFAYLEQMEQDVASLEERFQSLSDIRACEDDLKKLLSAIVADQTVLSRLPDVDHALIGIQQCEVDLQNYNTVKDRAAILSTYLGEIKQASSLLDRLSDVSAAMREIEEVEQLLNSLIAIVNLERCGTDMLNEEVVVRCDLQKVSKELAISEERFHKEMPLTCPLCGRKGKV